jgi:glyoxylase-like metal-dependent hydrolase (beta-lactamase superfamily II)
MDKMNIKKNMDKKKIVIGDYEICAIPTGPFGLDGGAMFGTVPKILWEKAIPSDEKNRIPMEARACLLKGIPPTNTTSFQKTTSTTRNILIDTGNGGDFIAKFGEKLGGKFKEMYNIDSNGPSLLSSLKKNGLEPDEITDVILTHLHFDHAGGATHVVNDKLVPTFKNATYYIQSANLETAKNPNLRERASYYSVNFQPLLDAGVLKILNGPCEILPGVSVLVSNGHTTGQQLVKITGSSECATLAGGNTTTPSDFQTLLYCGDLIPTSAHVKLAWVMGYDLRPLELIEEKEKLLSQAADQSWILFFEHDPNFDAAKVSRSGSDFIVSEKFVLANGLVKN